MERDQSSLIIVRMQLLDITRISRLAVQHCNSTPEPVPISGLTGLTSTSHRHRWSTNDDVGLQPSQSLVTHHMPSPKPKRARYRGDSDSSREQPLQPGIRSFKEGTFLPRPEAANQALPFNPGTRQVSRAAAGARSQLQPT